MARVGRKPLDGEQPSVGVQVRVPTSTYDRLYDLARREGVCIPAIVRRAVTRELRRQDEERDEDE